MKKSSIFSVILGIIGVVLTLIGGVTKNAYTTGYSYIVTYAEEQAIIEKAQACIYIGLILVVVAVVIYIKAYRDRNG